MGPLEFSVLTLMVALVWVPRHFVRMPITPRIINLPVIFSLLFLAYFTQHIFITEVVYNIPVSHWSALPNDEKSLAFAFLFMYLLVFWLAYVIHNRMPKQPKKSIVLQLNSFVTGLVIWIVAFGALALYILATGGIQQFITDHRETVYLNQWSRSIEAEAFNQTRILTGFVMTLAAVIGGYLAGTHEKASASQKLIYYSLPLPATLVKLALLSRGFFLIYALFFLSKTIISNKQSRYSGLRIALIGVIVLVGALFSLEVRQAGSFALENKDQFILFVSNSINGISPFLDTVAISSQVSLGGLHRILLELSPIPSFIYSSGYESNLTTLVLGQTSGSSTPMPFIGEAFFNLGWGGLALAYMQGFMAALVNSKVANPASKDRVWWLLLYIATVYSFLYMPHSGIRSCTRPFVWVLTLYTILGFFRMIAPKRSSKL